ncbi:MAG: hypothetical protein M3416_07980, partial [Acidobacteriota bacterium]|nr:hypothetical protein [Acidobacteriota bacterium]
MTKPTKPAARKSGKKSSKTGRPSRAAASATRFPAAETRHKERAMEGKSGKGADLNVGRLPTLSPEEAAGLGTPAANVRRPPPHTRYLVDMETFIAMKKKVEQSKAKPAKPGTTITADKGRKGGPATLA